MVVHPAPIRLSIGARRPMTRGVTDRPTCPDRESPRPRVNRHRPHLQPVPAPAPPAPVRDDAPPRRAPAPAPARPRPLPAPVVHDQTPGALSRPAHVSDRCMGCGAPTRGRARMATELVEVGPVRALRVVACSACPPRRRRDGVD
jgi:hypothetical protein